MTLDACPVKKIEMVRVPSVRNLFLVPFFDMIHFCVLYVIHHV